MYDDDEDGVMEEMGVYGAQDIDLTISDLGLDELNYCTAEEFVSLDEKYRTQQQDYNK